MSTHTRQPHARVNLEALKRQPNKFATTNGTNAIVEAMRAQEITDHTSNTNPTIFGPPWAFIGRVTLTPPGGVADYSDQRYWVVPMLINAGGPGTVLAFSDDLASYEFQAVEVENFSERPALPDGNIGTHTLAEGTVVYVFAANAADDDGTIRYFMITGGAALPVGQYPGMFLGMLVDNTLGFAFPWARTTV